MFARALKLLTAPRLWIGAGVALAAFGLVHGYVIDQAAASRVIDHQEQMVLPVFAQAFDPERHIGVDGKASILGEADFAASQVIDTGDRRRFFVVPLSGVSDGGRRAAMLRMIEVIQQGADPGPHRPVARPEGNAVSTTRALLVFEMTELADAPMAFSDIGLRELGTGFHGSVVQVMGQLSGQAMSPGFDVSAMNLDLLQASTEVPIVLPSAILDPAGNGAVPSKAIARFQTWLGVLIATVGFFVVLKGHRFVERYMSKNRKVTVEPDNIPKVLHGSFAPIASQGAITSEEGRQSILARLPGFDKGTKR